MIKSSKNIRILLADDHAVVRAGVRTWLSVDGRVSIVGEAGDGEEALRKCMKLRPDIAILDIRMPKLGGLEVAKRLKREAPNVRVLILTMHVDPEYLRQIEASGARGYVLKDATPGELANAISTVHSGRRFVGPSVETALLDEALRGGRLRVPGADELTRRELEVWRLIAEGLTNKEAASRLNLSCRTVESHRGRVMEKLGARTAADLARLAIKRGLIS